MFAVWAALCDPPKVLCTGCPCCDIKQYATTVHIIGAICHVHLGAFMSCIFNSISSSYMILNNIWCVNADLFRNKRA